MFAPKSFVVDYRGCRRPGSDFDETRTRGASGPETKSGGPLSAHPAHMAGPGAAKMAVFGFCKKSFFGHNFFISNRSDMFAMGFW